MHRPDTGRPTGLGLYAFGFGRTVNHTNAVLISLELFTTNDCTGGAVDTQQFQVFPAMDTWAFAHTVGTAPASGARSARLWATAFSSAAGPLFKFNESISLALLNFEWVVQPLDCLFPLLQKGGKGDASEASCGNSPLLQKGGKGGCERSESTNCSSITESRSCKTASISVRTCTLS